MGGGAGIGARRLGRDPAHLLALLQADDSPAAFWAFADAWTPDPARANETCWGALGRSVRDMLPPSSARALQYALAARQASARVALTASLLDADGGAPDDGACCVAVLPGGVRVTDARDRFDVTYPTARSDLKKLERAGIVSLLGVAPQLTYFSVPILRTIYDD